MDRLTSRATIKHSDGTEHVETYCHGSRYGPAAFPSKYGTTDPKEYTNYCETIDRLAAYEDAGLTPEQVSEIQAELAALRADIEAGRLVMPLDNPETPTEDTHESEAVE